MIFHKLFIMVSYIFYNKKVFYKNQINIYNKIIKRSVILMKITITTLGSISPYSKENMNCPGFLIEYQTYKILLDCGNGIIRLLHFPSDLNNLHVFLTHFHSDHIGDIGSLQYASFCHHNLGNLSKKIQIYLPDNDFRFNRAAILSNKESFADYHSIQEKQSNQIGDFLISFEDNHSHSIESYMIKLQSQNFKLVYTSDIGTSNINGIINFAKDSDLLICESSFLEAHNSSTKTHMTASKAGEIAKLAQVKQLLLTHFWPEENKSSYLKEAQEIFPNTEIATEGTQLIFKK